MRRALLLSLALIALGGPALALPKSYGIAKGWPLGPGQPQQTLNALTLSTSSANEGSPFTATVQNSTPGSTLTLPNTVGGKYSLSGLTLSGTNLVQGVDAPAIRETLTGATNSPR